ncbi:uncharacterized [Tachysurus ichikawai]
MRENIFHSRDKNNRETQKPYASDPLHNNRQRNMNRTQLHLRSEHVEQPFKDIASYVDTDISNVDIFFSFKDATGLNVVIFYSFEDTTTNYVSTRI